MSTNKSALTKPAQRPATTATLATYKPIAKGEPVTDRQMLPLLMTDGNFQGIAPRASPLASAKPYNLEENNKAWKILRQLANNLQAKAIVNLIMKRDNQG